MSPADARRKGSCCWKKSLRYTLVFCNQTNEMSLCSVLFSVTAVLTFAYFLLCIVSKDPNVKIDNIVYLTDLRINWKQ